MKKRGYNRNRNNNLNQHISSVNRSSTFGDKSIYPPMTSKERDDQIDILLQKNKEIQNKMDIAEAKAEANSEAREHNKNEIQKLDSEKSKEGIISRVGSYFSYGNTHKLNENIKELQSEQAKHELHDQELRNQIRAHVLEQEDIMRSKNDINRMYRDSGNDNTDGYRLSRINANYFAICKFIETYVEGFTFKEQLALMHALANEVSIQYFGNKGYKKPIDALYENPIDDKMLISTSNKMDIFKNVKDLKPFLKQARHAEQAKQREKIASSQRHKEIFANVLKSRPIFSVVNPELFEENPQKYQAINYGKRKRDEDEVKNDNKSKSRRKTETGGGRRTRRHRRSRKSKK
jgi:hypothetical protein